jgi:hypothetical protein
MRGIRQAIVLLAVVALPACRTCPPRTPPKPSPGERCTSNAECVTPFTCQHPDDALTREAWLRGDDRGYCTRACQSNADCGAGICAGLCQPAWLDVQIQMTAMVVNPAPVEMSPWVQAAVGWRFEPTGSRGVASFGAGLETTFGLATIFPSRSRWRLPKGPNDVEDEYPALPRDPVYWEDAWHLRAGPWLAVETPLDRVRGEGGVALTFGSKRVVSLSTFGLRVGGGYGSVGVAHATAMLSWGVRYVKMRVYDPHPLSCKPVVAPASGLRLFVGARRELDAAARSELTFGIEWEPAGRGLGVVPCLER